MQFLRNVCVLLLICCYLLAPIIANQQKLDVKIYYEALCPESVRLIQSFNSAYEKLGRYLNVEFIPFGKAYYSYNSFNGWEIRCQHGPPECYSNKMQACALQYTTSQEVHAKFVHCIMTSGAPVSNQYLMQCANQANIPWTFISYCRDNPFGDGLLALNGYKTYTVQPQITFIPTIVYNNVYNQTNQDNAQKNLFETTCNLFKKKPIECN